MNSFEREIEEDKVQRFDEGYDLALEMVIDIIEANPKLCGAELCSVLRSEAGSTLDSKPESRDRE